MQIQVSDRNRKTVLPIRLINTAADRIKDEATALTLSQQILEMTMELVSQPTKEAMHFLKKEMEQFY